MLRTLPTMMLILAISIATSCSPQNDPRYSGWNRYTDEADAYVILVPTSWEATDDARPGIRGTRFNPTMNYTGDMAGFVHFSVLVHEPPPSGETFAQRAEAAVNALIAGQWQEPRITSREATTAGQASIVFEITGTPLYSSFTLQGRADVFEFKGKLFVLFAGATTNSWGELGETFDLIRNSIRLQ